MNNRFCICWPDFHDDLIRADRQTDICQPCQSTEGALQNVAISPTGMMPNTLRLTRESYSSLKVVSEKNEAAGEQQTDAMTQILYSNLKYSSLEDGSHLFFEEICLPFG